MHTSTYIRFLSLSLIVLAAPIAGCSGDEFTADPAPGPETNPPATADLAGDYTIAVTNKSNGCGFDGWEQGKTATDLPFLVTQDGDQVTGTVGGAAGALVELWLGSSTFEGTVTGTSFSMTSYGTNSGATGGCALTINAIADGTSDGDLIEGTLRYTPETNGSPDCGQLNDCETVQAFNGTRPPQ